MKINVMNDGVPCKYIECHLNPATVCVAERKDVNGESEYLLHTNDGDIWEVAEDDYERVIAWMETHE